MNWFLWYNEYCMRLHRCILNSNVGHFVSGTSKFLTDEYVNNHVRFTPLNGSLHTALYCNHQPLYVLMEVRGYNNIIIEDIAMQYLPWFFFGCNTHKGPNDFFSQKLFKPRRPFFYTSKYETLEFFRKKIKFFYPRVFEIFDSKHGSPENYSDFFFFSSSRSRAMRSPQHNSSKILSNRNEILQTCKMLKGESSCT